MSASFLSAEQRASLADSPLFNDDLAPVQPERRRWRWWNFAALWISMAACIPTYMLASSLIDGGMNWWQAVLTIFLGNMIVLAPMLLNSHPGAKYGVPFPVLARASFGVLGANVAAVLRALVACGWFGIQTWIGGEAISTLVATLAPGWKNFPYATAICFLLFWLINLAVILMGIEYIRILQGISAPVLLAVGLLLLAWAYHGAGGFGPMLAAPSRFTNFTAFLKFLIPALNGTVGFWATVSLNIPDFTRFARNQREQIIGQALALPTTMTLYAFIGIAVTSATVVIYGTAISDPVQLLSRFHSPVAVVISLIAILLATLNVNIGANVVSPANDFSNLWPRRISFRTGGVITCLMGIALMPWKLLADYNTFILGWLGNLDPNDYYYAQQHTGGSFDFQKYSNPTVDKLLDQASTITNFQKRKSLYDQAAKIIVDQASYIYLYNPNVVQGYSTELHGYTVRADRAVRFNTAYLG